MIAAVVLAAGQSKRMGRPKMTLPWGRTTVIGQVVSVLAAGGAEEIIVATGSASQEVENSLKDAVASGLPVRTVFTPFQEDKDMARSLMAGLSVLKDEVEAALVVLGDQPEIQVEVVREVITTYQETRAILVVPSYHLRRGHPWLIARRLWANVYSLPPNQSLRDLLNAYAEDIVYVTMDTPSVLQDMDTPEDYTRIKPSTGE